MRIFKTYSRVAGSCETQLTEPSLTTSIESMALILVIELHDDVDAHICVFASRQRFTIRALLRTKQSRA